MTRNTVRTAAQNDLLETPLSQLWGVGPERATQLARLGFHTVRDLLWHPPRRYEDRQQIENIASLRLSTPATVRGQIVALGIKRFAHGQKSVFEFILDDGTARLHCRWWNLPYMQDNFKQGEEVLVFGKPNALKPRTMDHPETEVIDAGLEASIHLNRIVPIYPLTEGLPQRSMRSLVWRALNEYAECIPEPWPTGLTQDFLPCRQAVQRLHFPNAIADASKARQRLAFDELLQLQLAIQGRRQKLLSKAQGLPCGGNNALIRPFLARLGFQLTAAQTKVLREMRADLSSGRPMRRLLQGDVGSGKTVVAACCALLSIESGFGVAVMAPTEILSEQHYRNFKRWLEPLGIAVHLHTGSHRIQDEAGQNTVTPPRPEASLDSDHAPATTGAPALVVGTHALVEHSFLMENLGLVIIDEQHRFGVVQREKLVRKGHYPHLLVMTATPIPRTLGLTLYGDLDISVLDQLPAGRPRIRTFVRTAASLPKVWTFIRSKIAEGRQAFVVFPRVEDTGQPVKAVIREFEGLAKDLAPYKVGMIHGRLNTEEKEKVMSAFRANQLQVLLSTSLIEVGIDVPNATVMLIDNAEQFGLAQLHQLRGRIGRGAHESYCILVAHAKTVEAQQRLRIMSETTDGFRIAQADLTLRGPGDLLGQQQSGLPPLVFADLSEDLPLVERARAAASELLEQAVRSSAAPAAPPGSHVP